MDERTKQTWANLGVDTQVDFDRYPNVPAVVRQAVDRYPNKPAFSSLGHTLSFAQFDQLADQFARYLQNHTPLKPGDRIALQLPNLIQYPVVLHGALRAGLIVVNTNPLYTARELQHQLQDSGARAIVVLANVSATLRQVLASSALELVIVTELADLHPPIKRTVINLAARYIKRMVPEYRDMAYLVTLREALAKGASGELKPVSAAPNDIAVLQYTGGTTGIAKGAMLTHRNLLANFLQCERVFGSYGLSEGGETLVMPLPLYHIYSFITGLVVLVSGNHAVLVPDPRNLPALIKDMKKYCMTMFCGINTLFVALCNKPEFRQLDFSRVKLVLSGGMALTADAASQWHAQTGVEVHQGYGLTETSPVVSVNPGGGNRVETIGLPVPGTEVMIADAQGQPCADGEAGELWVRGPQVMLGYWQRPDATAEIINKEGWLATGDIAVQLPDGYLKIVDRKKDMIVVSGFNVYPNELEDVVSAHPKVRECAAIGVPDARSGEAVKMFVVRQDPSLNEEELIAYCRENLTGYKIPRQIVFRDELPKSAVGKILRRELRDQ